MTEKKIRLHYYNKNPNVGDALNPWLWSRLLPNALEDNGKYRFCAIGTLINDNLPEEDNIIFGSGVGYHKKLPNLKRSTVFFFRGPLSAKEAGFSTDYALTDPAILVSDYKADFVQSTQYKYGLILHHNSMTEPFNTICRITGVNFISPTLPVENFFTEILKCEILICEAMHGAIFADSFRIPWIPVIYHNQILKFKWHDWCQSMELSYNPIGWTKPMGYTLQLMKYFPHIFERFFVSLISFFWIFRIKNAKTYLSKDAIFKNRLNRVKYQLDLLQQYLNKEDI